MPYAINIRSDHNSSDYIRSLWTKCGVLEQTPSMEAMSYPPHITFAIYDEVPLQDLFVGLSSAAQQLERTSITFDSLNYFETPGGIVMWAAPRLSDKVFAAHNSIHAQIDQRLCREHYQPKNWVPHCSLAISISTNKKEEVLALIAQPIEPIDVVFDTVDCASFMPVNVLREFPLAL